MIEDTYQYADTRLIAKYMVAYAKKEHISMNITKLQKLLFVLYGTYLIYTGKRLTDEHPHAWPFGPVFPSIRKDYLKHDGYQDITLDSPELAEVVKDENLAKCMEAVMRVYGKFNATSLVDWTHEENSPWTKTTQRPNFQWNDTICDEDIYAFFDACWD